MKSSVRTIYGSGVTTANRYGDPYRYLANSTLNEKFNVQRDALPYDGERLTTRYFAIGLNGAMYERDAATGIFRTKFHHYKPDQASLFKPVPFVSRRVDNDLEPEERAKYRMRTVQTLKGVPTALYWLRVLDFDGNPADFEHRTVIDGRPKSNPWKPVAENLNPVPMDLEVSTTLVNGDEYLAVSKKFKLEFTPRDIEEILNVGSMLYGDSSLMELSEFALVSGVDRIVPGDFNGLLANYTEVIYAQCNDYLKTRVSAPDSLGGKTINIDAGAVEPLLLADRRY